MSETDSFIAEVTEDVRRDRLFRLFRRYGWIPALAIVAIVSGTAYNEWAKTLAETEAQNRGDRLLAALEIEAERILVVCPSSLKINWMREIENFCEDVSIIKGKHWDPDRFTIINYDILKNFHTIE